MTSSCQWSVLNDFTRDFTSINFVMLIRMQLTTNKLQILLAGYWLMFDFAFGKFVTFHYSKHIFILVIAPLLLWQRCPYTVKMDTLYPQNFVLSVSILTVPLPRHHLKYHVAYQNMYRSVSATETMITLTLTLTLDTKSNATYLPYIYSSFLARILARMSACRAVLGLLPRSPCNALTWLVGRRSAAV